MKKNGKKLWSIVVLILCDLIFQVAWARAPWQQPDYVEKAFIEIAFKREYQSGLFRLVRWEEPIRYYIIYDHIRPLPILYKTIEKHIDDLRRLTGHPIIKADNRLDANLQILLTRGQDYARQIRQRVSDPDLAQILSSTSNCVSNFHTNSRHEITEGWVLIPADTALQKGIYYGCVVEELTQVMGLPNDSDWVRPSIANDHDPEQQSLSPLDRQFLRLLYSPTLRPGMTVEEARPLLHDLIRHRQHTLYAAPERNENRYTEHYITQSHYQ